MFSTTQIANKLYTSFIAKCFLLAAFAAIVPSTRAATYYVALNGNDSNSPGMAQKASTPWATISHASSEVKPGDSVIVAPGNYPSVYSVISAHGTADQPIRFIGSATQPMLTAFAGSTVTIVASSYIVFDNFDVTNTDRVVSGRDGGNGITLGGNSTHITVENCTVHDCGGGGISTVNQPMQIGCDYITVKHNTVYNNAWYSGYSCSGISLWEQSNANPADKGVHNYIVGNVCYGNSNKYLSDPSAHTDGEGIILDVSYSFCSQQGGGNSPDAATYVGYNTCYDNGGAGIESFHNDTVTITHNTCYHNAADPGYTGGGGEIWVNQSTGCRISNNVVSSSGSNLDACVRIYGDKSTTVITNNDYWNGVFDGPAAGNTSGDPQFKDVSDEKPNFKVARHGPADPASGPLGAWGFYLVK